MSLEKTCNRYVAYWKPRLGLSDWTVEVEASDPWKCRTLGKCSVNRERRIATVTLAVPHPADEDLESTVVHELLHLYFDLQDFDPKDYAQVQSEQGIDAIANLLVRMNKQCQAQSNGSQTKPTKKPTSRKRR